MTARGRRVWFLAIKPLPAPGHSSFPTPVGPRVALLGWPRNHAGVFDALTALTELYLSHNSLTELPDDVFEPLTKPTVTIRQVTVTAVPGAPTGLTATASGSTTINLSWTAPASTGYRIEVSLNGTSNPSRTATPTRTPRPSRSWPATGAGCPARAAEGRGAPTPPGGPPRQGSGPPTSPDPQRMARFPANPAPRAPRIRPQRPPASLRPYPYPSANPVICIPRMPSQLATTKKNDYYE